jgi:hypothetical protein
MNWEDHTIHTLKKLRDDKSYSNWSSAIEDKEISKFSDELDELLRRLAGIVISELEIDSTEKDKIVKLMELAAVAGRKL